VPVSLSLVRDSFRHLCDSFIQSKVSYHQVTFFYFGSCSFALCISCTTRLVAYVLFVPIPRTLPWIFTLFITGVWTSLSLRHFLLFTRWFLLLRLAIMRFLYLGISVCMDVLSIEVLVLGKFSCVYNLVRCTMTQSVYVSGMSDVRCSRLLEGCATVVL
jgi:hypothetical protein